MGNNIRDLLQSISDSSLADAVRKWLELPLSPCLKSETRRLLEEKNIPELSRRFLSPLSFGTAGIRVPMGEGFGYLNEYTVAKISLGLSEFLSQSRSKVVLVGYDSRHNSLSFALTVAKTFLSRGFSVSMFSIPTPIPILAYATRFYQACVGVMVTASHNPKQDNGYKIFNSSGGQFTPTETQKISECINNAQNVPFEQIRDSSLDSITNPDIQMLLSFFQDVKSYIPNFFSLAEYAPIVYSPLMGAGKHYAKEMVEFLGGNLRIVEEDNHYDGSFSPFRSPNPENPETFQHAIPLAEQIKAPLCVVTDPDADRLGVWEKGHHFNGNDLGILLSFFLLEHQPHKRDKYIFSSVVSTQLIKHIADYWGCPHGQTPTGFKYIGSAIEQNPSQFLFGFEESGGYLIGPYIQDKDAIGTLGFLSVMSNYLYSRGKTLMSYLEDIHKTVGFSQTKNIEVSLQHDKISQFLEELQNQHTEIFHRKIVEDIDFLTKKKFQKSKEVDFPSEWSSFPSINMRIFYLESHIRIAIRPSGTEAKLKFYLELLIPSKENFSYSEKMAFVKTFYSLKEHIEKIDSF